MLNLNKKPGHQNSPEFQAIENALKVFYDPEKKTNNITNMSPEDIRQNLNSLKSATDHYKEEKLDQSFHWLPSGQRQYRLMLSDNLANFAVEQKKLMDTIRLDSKTIEMLSNTQQELPKKYDNITDFVEEARKQKAKYEKEISGFSKIVQDVKNHIEHSDIGNQYNMDDQQKTNEIKDAIIFREVRKKLWDYDPGQQELGAHILNLNNIKNQTRTKVENELNLPENQGTLTKFVKKAIDESKNNPEMKTSKIAYRWDSKSVKKNEFGHIHDYELAAKNQLDKNIKNQLQMGAKINQIV